MKAQWKVSMMSVSEFVASRLGRRRRDAMALSAQRVQEIDAEAKNGFRGFPLGKIICIAEAGWKAFKCETSGGQHCIETLVKDIEACLK
jgi:hypothetical protein